MDKKQPQPNNPLHGVKLVDIMEYLTENYTWEGLGMRIDIRCFTHRPSIKSSLNFLRKHQWARDKVEELYLHSVTEDEEISANRQMGTIIAK